MSFSPDLPFNDLPDLPPPAELETKAVLKRVVSARAALAALAESLAHLPNAHILTNSIVLQEAKDSSEIENIITTHDELFRSIAMDSSLFETSETKEVKRYREALNTGHELLRSRGIVNTTLLDSINATLLGYRAGVRKTPGTKLLNTRSGETVYTPPEGYDTLVGKLDRLWDYIHSAPALELDPLIRLSLLHYQFEAIHPYIDGNGRTGRILNVLYLVYCGLLPLPVLYMSSQIIQTKARYYDLLRNITAEGRWEEWILYNLEVVESTANKSRELIAAIRSLRAEVTAQVQSAVPHMRHSHEFVEVLFTQPYSRIEFFVQAKIGNRKTVAGYLRLLEGTGLLRSIRFGPQMLFINLPLFNLLSGTGLNTSE